MNRRCNITTAIPYVNGPPHLGFALELVQADVLARHRRSRGWEVRLQSGTDDNSLKNVRAAEAAGVPVAGLVGATGDAFEALRRPLDLSLDDFIRTSSDPRHRPGVARLWRACAERGDLYRKHYEGLYCLGCEQFYGPDGATADGCCPEHGVPLEPVAEDNWFFRLSRYEDDVHRLIADGRLRIEPEGRRNEALAFIGAGLEDLSVSRSVARARGWGVPVPDDPGQVVYVWFDALANYVTALGFGGDDTAYRHWWVDGDRRVHVIGKGILRFHAIYWPAILLSAGEPLPTDVFVHDYLTIDGRKLGKSSGNGIHPAALVDRFGPDAVRWWLVRDVPRVGDVDFTVERLVDRANQDLAHGAGNLASRVATAVHRFRGGVAPAGPPGPAERGGPRLRSAIAELPRRIDDALDAFDIRRAAIALTELVDEANRYVEAERPWELARAERAGASNASARLDSALALLVDACRALAAELRPFLPEAAARLAHQFDGDALPPPARLFPRLDGTDAESGVAGTGHPAD
jgi:methionyl-tRNA synthetase